MASMEASEPHPSARRKRFEDTCVSFKHVVYAIPFIAMALAAVGVTFASFLMGRMAAEDAATNKRVDVLEARQAADRIDTNANFRLMDQKLDRMDAKMDRLIDSGTRPATMRQR